MKLFFKYIVVVFCVMLVGSVNAQEKAPKDTLVVNFGKNSKVVFYISSKEDLELIKKYDLNAIFEHLSLKVEENAEEGQLLKVEDASGEKYLKDTTIVIKDRIVVKEDEDTDPDASSDRTDEDDDDDDFWGDDDDEDDDGSISTIKKRKRTRHSFNFELGTNNYLSNGQFPDENNELFAVRPWGSWYAGFTSMNRTQVAGVFFLDWGWSLHWYNFKFQEDNTRIRETDTGVVFELDQTDVNAIKSKLKASYISFVMVPMLDFGRSSNRGKNRFWSGSNRGLRIGAGGYTGYRIASTSKFVFNDGDGRERDKDRDNFFLNNFRYGVRLQLGYRDFDFFVNYDLNELFAEGRGPELNAISFGITL
ncbi:MAG: hypothetical protein AAFX87_17580 [Bacteroidota bacterium]